jgi:hypothetical protein
MSDERGPGASLDERIEGALAGMMDGSSRPDLRARVMARIEARPSEWPAMRPRWAMAAVGAMLAVGLAAVALHEPRQKPPAATAIRLPPVVPSPAVRAPKPLAARATVPLARPAVGAAVRRATVPHRTPPPDEARFAEPAAAHVAPIEIAPLGFETTAITPLATDGIVIAPLAIEGDLSTEEGS